VIADVRYFLREETVLSFNSEVRPDRSPTKFVCREKVFNELSGRKYCRVDLYTRINRLENTAEAVFRGKLNKTTLKKKLSRFITKFLKH